MEKWIKYADNERYIVSNTGLVKDLKTGKMVNIQVRKDGYNKVSLVDESKEVYEKGRFTCIFLHRLVAACFIPNKDNKPEINHKDRNKSNNSAENLEWCTHQENIIHSFKTRITPKGADHWMYGTKKSKEARAQMSAAKMGERHPKFKGWYIKDGVKYSSARQAAEATKENQKTIIIRAAKNERGWLFLPKVVE